jgi:hypothetical protein
MKETFERFLQGLVLCALIEFADKMPTNFERIEAELQHRSAEILANPTPGITSA